MYMSMNVWEPLAQWLRPTNAYLSMVCVESEKLLQYIKKKFAFLIYQCINSNIRIHKVKLKK